MWGVDTVNATKLTAFAEQNDLVMHDLSPECTGPNYTFWDSRGNRSYIDHCVVRSSMVGNVNIRSFVYGDVSGISTSDHLTIIISFSYFSTSLNNGRKQFREKIKWHRCDMSYIKQQYTEPLDCAVGHILKDFVDSMTEIAKKNIKTQKFKKHVKPYWNKYLSLLAKDKRLSWIEWVNAGRPACVDDPTLIKYKTNKKALREAIRAEHNLKISEIKKNWQINAS